MLSVVLGGLPARQVHFTAGAFWFGFQQTSVENAKSGDRVGMEPWLCLVPVEVLLLSLLFLLGFGVLCFALLCSACPESIAPWHPELRCGPRSFPAPERLKPRALELPGSFILPCTDSAVQWELPITAFVAAFTPYQPKVLLMLCVYVHICVCVCIYSLSCVSHLKLQGHLSPNSCTTLLTSLLLPLCKVMIQMYFVTSRTHSVVSQSQGTCSCPLQHQSCDHLRWNLSKESAAFCVSWGWLLEHGFFGEDGGSIAQHRGVACFSLAVMSAGSEFCFWHPNSQGNVVRVPTG